MSRSSPLLTVRPNPSHRPAFPIGRTPLRTRPSACLTCWGPSVIQLHHGALVVRCTNGHVSITPAAA
jgi:hypothetical protein